MKQIFSKFNGLFGIQSHYQQMKIRTQIFSGFLLILLLTLVLAGVTIYYLSNLGNASNKILEENYRSVKATEGIIISLSKIDQILSKICLGSHYNDSTLITILENEKNILQNNLIICQDNAGNETEIALINQIESDYIKYKDNIGTFKNTTDPVGLYFTVLQRQNEILRENTVQLATINHKDLSAKDEFAQSLYFRSKIYVFLIMVLVLLIVGWAVYQVPHEIVKPITKITEKIKGISQGEYQQQIVVDSQSELGELAKAFNMMSIRLQEFEKLNIEEVQAQKSRMESIIKSLNDGLIILDEKGEIILVNSTGKTLIGLNEKQLMGHKLRYLAKNNEVLREIAASLENQEKVQDWGSGERHSFLKITSEDDKISFYAKDIVKVYSNDDSDRKFIGHIITLKDITSFKESDEAKSNFIAVVSHELKTPLSALNMSLMLLRDSRFGNLNEEQEKITASMKREVQRLVNMVTELLDLSKVESGKINLEEQAVSPRILMEYALAPVEAKFNDKGIEIVKQYEHNLPDVYVDPEKISWVLINLMTNAIRYSQEGGRVILSTKRINQEVEFGVEDFGPGIAKEDLKRVFNKFVQLQTNGKKNKHGLGLGLAISKEVVEAHGGEISVISEIGRGSRFFFRVPLEQSSVVLQDSEELIQSKAGIS